MKPHDQLGRVRQQLATVLRGRPESIDLVMTGLLARGHVLIEDVPGVGKTMLTLALARTFGLDWVRVQFTADMLPSDLTGVSIFHPERKEFIFRPGPLFAQVVLADEINRAPAKTQSALLEAMEEKQVSVDGKTHKLPRPFFVLATQNPEEQQGTFPLPESQLDRFLLRIQIGYPPQEEEIGLVRDLRYAAQPPALEAIATGDQLQQMMDSVDKVAVSEDVAAYIVALARATRENPAVRIGVSPRGVLALAQASRARAYLSGRDYVLPDDVQHMAPPVLVHRITPAASTLRRREASMAVLDQILNDAPVPV